MKSKLQDAHSQVTAAAEREVYSQAIRLTDGDQSKAAQWLGVSRRTMRERLLRYGLIPTREFKSEPAV